MSLNKVVKDKGKLRDPNPKLNHHRNDLKASVSARKGILFSCSHSAELAESQMQKLIP